jgi:ferredoxin
VQLGGAPACADACPTQAITFDEAATVDWIGPFAAERTGYVLQTEAATPRGRDLAEVR